MCDAIAASYWSAVGLCRRQDNRTDLETYHMQPCCYSFCPLFHTCTRIIITLHNYYHLQIYQCTCEVYYSTVWYSVVDIRAA